MIQFHVDGLDETFEFVIVFGKDTSKDGNQGANYGSKTEFSIQYQNNTELIFTQKAKNWKNFYPW